MALANSRGVVQRTRAEKDARVGDDAKESAQHQVGDCESLVPRKYGFQPGTARGVFRSVVTIRRDEDVNVG